MALTNSPAVTKAKISITLDTEVVRLLKKIEAEHGTKISTYLNRVVRRHFIRPGKGMEAYALKKEAA